MTKPDDSDVPDPMLQAAWWAFLGSRTRRQMDTLWRRLTREEQEAILRFVPKLPDLEEMDKHVNLLPGHS